jgi:hypothetical protein
MRWRYRSSGQSALSVPPVNRSMSSQAMTAKRDPGWRPRRADRHLRRQAARRRLLPATNRCDCGRPVGRARFHVEVENGDEPSRREPHLTHSDPPALRAGERACRVLDMAVFRGRATCIAWIATGHLPVELTYYLRLIFPTVGIRP